MIVGVFAAAAVALLQQARMSANETSAVASMRLLVQGQVAYSASNNGYAGSIQALAGLCPGMKVGFVAADINRNGVIKSGYILNVVPGVGANTATTDCNGLPTHTKFYATAAPEVLGYAGKRGFAPTTTSTIWQNTAGTPPTEPITPSATVSVVGSSQ